MPVLTFIVDVVSEDKLFEETFEWV